MAIKKYIATRHHWIVDAYLTMHDELYSLPDLLEPDRKRIISAVKPFTLLGHKRLAKLYEIAQTVERTGIGGTIVECGVWNGGSAGVLAFVTKSTGREVWLFDSWEGLPTPTAYDVDWKGKRGWKGAIPSSLENVRKLLFENLGIEPNRIHLVRGWYNDTLPSAKDIKQIAILHIDCDWYESVKLCLEQLFDRVVLGGYVIIDDYGHWQGCKKAVDEFMQARNLEYKLRRTDYTSVYFQKN